MSRIEVPKVDGTNASCRQEGIARTVGRDGGQTLPLAPGDIAMARSYGENPTAEIGHSPE